MNRRTADDSAGAPVATEPAAESGCAPATAASAQGDGGGVQPGATSFPVVGIGASAGGLAAFEAFFSALPAGGDSGMAFVLVQHLSPDHSSAPLTKTGT